MRGIISRGTCKLTLLQAAKLLSTMKVKWKVVVFHSIVSRTLIVYHWLIETESIEECVVISSCEDDKMFRCDCYMVTSSYLKRLCIVQFCWFVKLSCLSHQTLHGCCEEK